ncbi:MAG: DEAD/DEAH box helicase [Alphaproteobacteria bacterium]
MTFAALGLADPLQRALEKRNHTTPTPIQAQSIPALLEGRDMLGIAQTGTGKTGAFALPILHKLFTDWDNKRGPRRTRALILAPTRELAVQISDEFRAYGANLPIRTACIFGGVGRKPQVDSLHRGVDVIVATPGRLLDVMNDAKGKLDGVEFLVLDEADRMLDMGFVKDVKKIIAALPQQRQSLLFSATMPKDIIALSREILIDPVKVEVTPEVVTVDKIDQTVRHVQTDAKANLLTKLLEDEDMSRVIVFTRTKHRANRVSDHLEKAGISADAIHGNKSQAARQIALKKFREGRARVLVATDIAARGIDVDAVSHVINFELPNEPESYVHRIGRTARAGASGQAISLCDASEQGYLKAIEKLTGVTVTVVGDPPGPAAPPPQLGNRGQSRGGQNRSNNNGPAKQKPAGSRGPKRRNRRGSNKQAA